MTRHLRQSSSEIQVVVLTAFAPEGSSSRGFAFAYIVSSEERVPAVLAEGESAGGTIVRPAQESPWGSFCYFTDSDGYLWKVASSGTHQPTAAK